MTIFTSVNYSGGKFFVVHSITVLSVIVSNHIKIFGIVSFISHYNASKSTGYHPGSINGTNCCGKFLTNWSQAICTGFLWIIPSAYRLIKLTSGQDWM